LIVAADSLALNDKLFSVGEQRQENINVDIIVSQMADIDRSRARLCGVVPNNVAIARIAARGGRIGAIQKQIG
jgi:hypothetical protein